MSWFGGLSKDKKILWVIFILLIIFYVSWNKIYRDMEQAVNVEQDNSDILKGYSDEKIKEILNDMSLEEKVYQMFIVSPEQITGVKKVVAAGTATKDALNKYPVGGIMYSTNNLQSKEQIMTVIKNSQSYSKVNLFIAVDEEGGKVSRLMNSLGTTRVDSMYTYKDDGEKVAKENAKTIAKDMKNLGFNLDFAPVADVWSNPLNAVIEKRAYSDDFEQASELVSAAVSGFKSEGVLCTLKHFPGHGDTVSDTHRTSAYVIKDKAELEKEELLPFKAGIKAGAELVMVGHMIMREIDNGTPASLSSSVVTDMLRDEMGFEGLIITDALNMNAIIDYEQETEFSAAVQAILAGNDLLLEPADFVKASDEVIEAVKSGEISESRIDESVLRILKVKEISGILE